MVYHNRNMISETAGTYGDSYDEMLKVLRAAGPIALAKLEGLAIGYGYEPKEQQTTANAGRTQ